MFNVLPLFKSCYSLSRSILTLEKYGSSSSEGASSIIDIVKNNNLPCAFLVEDNITSFLDANKSFKDINIPFYYGIRIEICPSIADKNDDSLKKSSKVIVFCKNGDGYKSLIKIWSKAATDGFYYKPRVDREVLKQYWSDNLKLSFPFYDSFLCRNSLSYSACNPNLEEFNPTYFIEDNDLPFDHIISEKVQDLAPSDRILKTKSIFYEQRKDFKAYLTFRCIGERTTLNKPQFDHMGSAEFCFEAWKEQNAR